jgi:hypothetical protein
MGCRSTVRSIPRQTRAKQVKYACKLKVAKNEIGAEASTMSRCCSSTVYVGCSSAVRSRYPRQTLRSMGISYRESSSWRFRLCRCVCKTTFAAWLVAGDGRQRWLEVSSSPPLYVQHTTKSRADFVLRFTAIRDERVSLEVLRRVGRRRLRTPAQTEV